MSDEAHDISRREVLGSVATVGGAAALGGAGSVAFLSDRETLADNRLVAGELDLKVDWEEHYSDWSEDEGEGIDVVRMEPADGLAGFPSAAPEADQSVFVSDVDQFLRNTAIEAFPDVLTDPAESDASYDALQAQLEDDSDICDLDADTPEVLSSPLRTQGTFPSVDGDANPQTTEPGDPLISIEDVKPGDFGEVTFSLHACGNPAFVWLTGALRDASENGLTESERKDEDEEEGVVELLDEIRAAVWYDTGEDGLYGGDFDDKDPGEGDNYKQTSEVLLPLNGSLRSVLTALEGGMFPLDAEPITTNGDGGGNGGGGSGASLADEIYVTTEDEEFTESGKPAAGTSRNYQCADYQELLDVGNIVGSEVIGGDTLQVGTTISGCTNVTVTSYEPSTGTVGLSTGGPVSVVSVKGGPNGEQVYVFDPPAVLDDVTVTTPGDFGISNIDVCCPVGDDGNGNGGGGGQQDGDRQCFPNSTTAYVGFEWWLPVNHANEIQTDSVAFDIGFYTEQCRHNDGRMGNDGGGGGPGGEPGDGETVVVDGDKAISWVALCCGSDPGSLEDDISCVTLDEDGEVDAVGISNVGTDCDVYYKTGDGIFTASDGSFEPEGELSDSNFCGAPASGDGDDEAIGTKVESGDIVDLKSSEGLPDCDS